MGDEVEKSTLAHRRLALATVFTSIISASALKLEGKSHADTSPKVGAGLVQSPIQQARQLFRVLASIDMRIVLVASSYWIKKRGETNERKKQLMTPREQEESEHTLGQIVPSVC